MTVRHLTVRLMQSFDDRVHGEDLQYLKESLNDVVILVHGFNVSEQEARADYDAFEGKIKDSVLGEPIDLFGLHWAGDIVRQDGKDRATLAALPKGLNWLNSGRTYDDRVPVADGAGVALGDLLCAPWLIGRRVYLIGHSLGNRLILRALRRARSRGSRAEIPVTVMMAAAVPTHMCEPGGIFGTAYPQTRYEVLFSPRDFVLRFLFQRGQSRLGPTELGEPVGLKGGPSNNYWEQPARNTGLQHGQYWNSNTSADTFRAVAGRLRPWVSPTEHYLDVHEL